MSSQHLASKIQANDINTQSLTASSLNSGSAQLANFSASSGVVGSLTTLSGDLKASRVQIGATTGSVLNGIIIGSFEAATSGFSIPNEYKAFPNLGVSDGTVAFIKGYTVNLPSNWTSNNNYKVFISIERQTPWGISPSIESRYVYTETCYVWDKGISSFTIDHLRFGNFKDDPAVNNYPLNPQATINYMVVKTE